MEIIKVQGMPVPEAVDDESDKEVVYPLAVIETEAQRLRWAEIVRKANTVHNNKYTYLGFSAHGTEGRPTAKTHLVIACAEHGEFRQAVSHHLNGSGCKPCGYNKLSVAQAYSFETWSQKAAELYEGKFKCLELLKSVKPPTLRVMCEVHGEFKQPGAQLLDGYGCPKCGWERGSEKITDKVEDVIARLQARDSSKIFNNVRRVQKDGMRWVFDGVCDKHGEFFEANARGYMADRRYYCAACGRDAIPESLKYTLDSVLQRAVAVHKDRYEYGGLVESEESFTKLEVICKKHGAFTQLVTEHILSGCGCPKCSGTISRPNIELTAFIESLGITAEPEFKVKGHIRNMAIDVKAGNLAIEHLGLRWHSTKYKPSTVNLRDRRTCVVNQGYEFVAIYEDEWQEKRSIVKRMLASKLGVATKSVGARTLQVEVSEGLLPSDIKFLTEYHIQGPVRQGVMIRLKTKEGQLVALAVFNSNTCSRKEKATDKKWELTRYASAVGVQGGLSRCIKAFKVFVPNAKTVVSYSDDRLHSGGAYAAIGFRKLYTTAPDYTYIVQKQRHHKSNFQKSRLAKMFPEEDMSLSEKEITEKHKIYRIYDCGKTKWELTL